MATNNNNSNNNSNNNAKQEVGFFQRVGEHFFPSPEEREKRLGNYNIIKKIGEGAEAIVFSGRRRRFRKDREAAEPIVALKVIRPNALRKNPNSEIIRRKLAQLSHKNIVKIQESFYIQPQNTIVTVMDYCGKGDLYPKIRQLQQENFHLPLEWIMKWFIEIAQALAYLHSKNFVHRDIKPENLFLTDDFSIKVGDFGVSKVLTKGNVTTTFVGTPCYMAPEMLEDKPKAEYDNTVDVWALGCITFELLTPKLFIFEMQHHQLPGFIFNKKRTVPSNKQTLAEIQNEQHETLQGYMPAEYPQELLNLIFKMLTALPKDRITAAQLLQEDYVVEWQRKLAAKQPDPSDIEVLLNCRRFSVRGAFITIRKGDIFKEKASAIVVPNSQKCTFDGGLAKLIAQKEPTIKDDLNEILKGEMLLMSEGVFTALDSSHVAAKGVIHVVGPMFSTNDCMTWLVKAFYSCMQVAQVHNCRSICFPSIGTGGSGISPKDCAIAFFEALERFANPNQMAITVVCHELPVLRAFNKRYEQLSVQEEDVVDA